MSKKLIFLDIDGTLVDFETKMPKSTEIILNRAVEEGHSLVINTGRFAAQVYPWLLQKVRFDGIISSSGANVNWKGNRISGIFWNKSQIEKFKNAALSVGAALICYTERELIAGEGAIEHQIDFFTNYGLKREQYSSLIENCKVADPVNMENIEKGIYIDSGHSIEEMQKILGDEFKIDVYSFGSIPPTSGEVTLSNVTKASGIDVLCEYLGIPLSDTVAVGDGSNDIEMIKHAGLGIAMGNSVDELKEAADVVTDSIDNDGIAKAFEKWIL